MRSMEEMMLTLMNLAFKAANCLHGSLQVCREGKKKFGTNPHWQLCLDYMVPKFLKAKAELLRALPNASAVELTERQMRGLFKMRRYPWIGPDMLKREPGLIRSIKDDFITTSADKCVLRTSNIRDTIIGNSSSTDDSDVFGVFATTDLNADELIFIDDTATAVLDNATNRCDCCCRVLRHGSVCLPCCAISFCTTNCAERAYKTYHRALCGKDLTSFENASRSGFCTPPKAAENLLLLRCLAMSLQSRCHPLQTPLIAQLTASYSPKFEWPYSFEHRIVRPTKMLQSLGVNIFTNLDYDTWVLSTMQMRLYNNQFDGCFGLSAPKMATLSRLRSFFNHSCEPKCRTMSTPAAHAQ